MYFLACIFNKRNFFVGNVIVCVIKKTPNPLSYAKKQAQKSSFAYVGIEISEFKVFWCFAKIAVRFCGTYNSLTMGFT